MATNSNDDGIYEAGGGTEGLYFNLSSPDSGLLSVGLWNQEGYVVSIKMVYKFIPMITGAGGGGLAEGTTQFERSTALSNEINFNFVGQGDMTGYVGDMNNDGDWDIMDVVMLVQCVLQQYCVDLDNPMAADTDGNGIFNILDIITLGTCILNSDCAEKFGEE